MSWRGGPGHCLSFGVTLALQDKQEGAEPEDVLLVGAKKMTVGVFVPRVYWKNTALKSGRSYPVVSVLLFNSWNMLFNVDHRPSRVLTRVKWREVHTAHSPVPTQTQGERRSSWLRALLRKPRGEPVRREDKTQNTAVRRGHFQDLLSLDSSTN